MLENQSAMGPEQGSNRNSDLIMMPELSVVLSANRPQEIRRATRSLVARFVRTDRTTFGIDFRGLAQTFVLATEGRISMEQMSFRESSVITAELHRSTNEISTVQQFLFWFNQFNRAGRSLSKYAEIFENMSTDTLIEPSTFKTLLTLPAAIEDAEGAEGRPLGNDIDRVIRACILVGLCENKQKFTDLMLRPGFKLLFNDGPRSVEDQSRDITNFIGTPTRWEDQRKTTKAQDGTVVSSLDTENINKLRGKLTKYGNIWARPETLDESDDFRKTLIELVGGNVLAVDLGVGLFKLFGMDADAGSLKYINDKGAEASLLEGWPNAGDLAKLMCFEDWQRKQNAAGHPCGPKETRTKIKKLLLPFLKFASIKIDKNGAKEQRSLYEAMWGYSDEPAKRLGDIGWEKLTNDVFNEWGSKISVPAGEKGLFNLLRAEKSDPDAMMQDSFWEFFKLNLNVVVNDLLVSEGELKGLDPVLVAKKVEETKIYIAKTYWDGVKSLPDYKYVWSGKYIDVFDQGTIRTVMGTPKKILMKDLIIESAKRSGFNLS